MGGEGGGMGGKGEGKKECEEEEEGQLSPETHLSGVTFSELPKSV